MTLLCANIAHAEIVKGTGEYSFGPDTAENVACRLAEEKAKQNAIANFVGELIEAAQNENCKDEKCTVLSTLYTEVSGEIKTILKKDKQVYPDRNRQVCEVDVVANVEKITNIMKFHVDGKNDFKQGERFVFKAVSGITGTVGVFNLVDKQYQLVYTDKVLEINKEVQIPSERYKMQAELPIGKSHSNELLVFLFTDKNLTFKNRYSTMEFEALVKDIPFSSRKVINHHVSIERQ
jgi:uncharacterized protein YbcV (DUF1398 family)